MRKLLSTKYSAGAFNTALTTIAMQHNKKYQGLFMLNYHTNWVIRM